MKVETSYLKDTSNMRKQRQNISVAHARDVRSSDGKRSQKINHTVTKKSSPSFTKKKVESSSKPDGNGNDDGGNDDDDDDDDDVPVPKGVKDAEIAVAMQQSSPPSSVSSQRQQQQQQKHKPICPYKKGDKIEGNHNNEGQWYSGTIGTVYDDDDFGYVYDIDYDDGDKESRVNEALIRRMVIDENIDDKHISSSSSSSSSSSLLGKNLDDVIDNAASIAAGAAAYKRGDLVEAQFDGHNGGSEYFLGKIAAVRGVDSYDIDYEDGDKESHVKARYIRIPSSSSSSSSPVVPAAVVTKSPNHITAISDHKKHHHHHHGGDDDDDDDEYGDDDFDDDFEDEE